MKVFILGGDGFIGSYLLKAHISRGDQCTVFDINNLRTVRDSKEYKYFELNFSAPGADSQFRYILDIKKPDIVYNCVAIATPSYYVSNPVETYNLDFDVNYRNICLPLIERDTPFVQFSTSEVYGKRWNGVYTEDVSDLIMGPTHKSRWIYATSKILLEQLLFGHKANCIIIRPQNFCGGDMDWLPDLDTNKDKTWMPRLPACFINNLLHNKPLQVVLPGTQKRCYTFIDDGVSAILALVDNWERSVGQVFNVGNPSNEATIHEVAELYAQTWHAITGTACTGIEEVKGEDFYGDGYEDCERRLFSTEKIQSITGWTPCFDLKSTIRLTLGKAITDFKQ